MLFGKIIIMYHKAKINIIQFVKVCKNNITTYLICVSAILVKTARHKVHGVK